MSNIRNLIDRLDRANMTTAEATFLRDAIRELTEIVAMRTVATPDAIREIQGELATMKGELSTMKGTLSEILQVLKTG